MAEVSSNYRGNVSGHGSLPGLVEPIAFLLGEWEGEGRGLWDDDFRFTDRLRFACDGRPLVAFTEETFVTDGAPSHGEAGYLLTKPGGVVHMTVAEPSGVAEILTGVGSGARLELHSLDIAFAPGARAVSSTARRLFLDGEALIVEVDIGVGGEPAAPHTRSVLWKKS